MKFILNLYDHCVDMHVKFHQGVSFIQELSFDYLNFNDFFRPQP